MFKTDINKKDKLDTIKIKDKGKFKRNLRKAKRKKIKLKKIK